MSTPPSDGELWQAYVEAEVDDDEYRRLAELLAHVEAWGILARLVGRALDSGDPGTREVAEDFTRSHGPMWLAGPDR